VTAPPVSVTALGSEEGTGPSFSQSEMLSASKSFYTTSQKFGIIQLSMFLK